LRLLGPEETLARGYSITLKSSTNQILRDPAGLQSGDEIRTRLSKGEFRSRKL
jgi:exonuclease VII large subunit